MARLINCHPSCRWVIHEGCDSQHRMLMWQVIHMVCKSQVCAAFEDCGKADVSTANPSNVTLQKTQIANVEPKNVFPSLEFVSTGSACQSVTKNLRWLVQISTLADSGGSRDAQDPTDVCIPGVLRKFRAGVHMFVLFVHSWFFTFSNTAICVGDPTSRSTSPIASNRTP